MNLYAKVFDEDDEAVDELQDILMPIAEDLLDWAVSQADNPRGIFPSESRMEDFRSNVLHRIYASIPKMVPISDDSFASLKNSVQEILKKDSFLKPEVLSAWIEYREKLFDESEHL